jgi:D-ribose pyranose/furanose isomerase RbsD
MNFPRTYLFAVLILLVQGCGTLGGGNSSWKGAVKRHTADLGFRNWIVICEASFPAHSRQGVHQVHADSDISEVLQYVLQEIEQTQHVVPNVYLTRELRSMSNDVAPGIDEHRARVQEILIGRETVHLDQESLMTLLADANRSFDVLIIRTDTALPYSTVFLELQPGYWDAESEQKLRERIANERKKSAAP